MGGNADEPDHIGISPNFLIFLVGSALAGGTGVGTFFGPKIEQGALQSCYDNSQIAMQAAQTALDVAAQHGDELLDIRKLLYERTEDRYTSDQAAKQWREHEGRELFQNRRLDSIERELDKQHDQ